MLPKEAPLEPSDITPAATRLPFFSSKMVNLSVEPDVPLHIHADLLATKAPWLSVSAIQNEDLKILARFVEWAYTGSYTVEYDYPSLDFGHGEGSLHIDMIAFADKHGVLELATKAQDHLSAVADAFFVSDARHHHQISDFVGICGLAVHRLQASHPACQDLACLTVRNLDIVRGAEFFDLLLTDYPEFAVAMVRYFGGPTTRDGADSWGLRSSRDGEGTEALSWHRDSSVVGREDGRWAVKGEQSRSVSDIDDPFRGWPVRAPSGSTWNDTQPSESW
ncbi:hypothetical protein BP00DRAFT_446182 [Aspergillus indologenus CBS 114.80]|uniref:BTB domain-containing protein n=1 Tax=Aspergillus indologenus CBS 114.80 TaxID=1450541 RepID=A0A2V5ICH1_9EURO|nr:hypothetical protein BP00DRAFT_446182 [Aspergillus indologenus CBS 114.80]